jgi:uncharacterized membrane protein YuzA (DUF378 family)
MAMTQLALVFLGSLATLATIGMFVNVFDRWTSLLVTFLAAILWATFGLSSFDVIVRDAAYASASEPITPLAYLGIGLAMIIGVYGLADLVMGVGEEASDTDMSEVMR